MLPTMAQLIMLPTMAQLIMLPTMAQPMTMLHNMAQLRVVGPCHHGMARPQVADRGTASFMEGSCEYIE